MSKAEQRRAGIRTVRVGAVEQLLQAAGRVVIDPRHRLRIAAPENGVILPPEGGFPVPGSRIEQGQVMAYLLPAIPLPERRGLESELALTQRDLRDSKLKAERFNADAAEEIEIDLPTPAIQILSEYHSAQTRERVIDEALRDRISLLATAPGVLARSSVGRDAVVSQGETLFEWGESDRFAVSVRLAGDAAGPFGEGITGDGRRVALDFLSETLDPRARMREAWFSVQPVSAAASGLAEGEVLRLVTSSQAADPIDLPMAALHGRAGRHRVWTHPAPEQFVQRAVQARVQGDGRVSVTGLAREERVVVAGGQFLQRRELAVSP
ncbi:MAG: hypothetical protein ACT4QA_15590 [Panacagrimonas sp.]